MNLQKLNSLTMLSFVGIALCSAANVAKADDFDGWLDKDRFQIRARAIAILADGKGQEEVTGLQTKVGDAVTPEIDFTYFFTKNVAAELIAGTAKHEIRAGSNDIGDAWILPPTLTLQYHFTPEKKFSPYVGAGVNYSYFYEEDDKGGFNSLDVEGGFGYALQAGFDYWLNDNWGLNLDAKYINVDVDVDAKSGTTQLRAIDVDLTPWVLGVGVSYRF
ncbi:MAG: Outer membrane protein W [Proteobacteria bacterium]|nr:MAG: Outer membrane protein W [Pseudomonadota bacterium]